MFRIATVALALSGLSLAQDKGPKAPDWVEITPERVEGLKAKRVLRIEDRVVFQIGFVRGTSSFSKKECVSAHLLMTNPTKKTLKAVLHVSLFDKDKRLVSTGRVKYGDFPDSIKPGEKSDGTSITLEAPPRELDRVKYAQGKLYVTE